MEFVGCVGRAEPEEAALVAEAPSEAPLGEEAASPLGEVTSLPAPRLWPKLAAMRRVLRPGGTIAILDINYTHEYTAHFRESGEFETVTLSGLMPLFLPMITRSCIAKRKQDAGTLGE